MFNRQFPGANNDNKSNITTNTKRLQHVTNKKHKSTHKLSFHTGIISSRYSQSSVIFQGPGQGFQCVANCILSLIYHTHKNSTSWACSDIKNILHSGNILYNSTGKVTTLLVSDLPKYIKLYNFIYHIQELNSVIGDIFVDNESFNSIAFSQLEHVIVKHKYLILVIGDSALSIIYNNTSFYVFDPHKRNTYGLPDSNGGAIVLKFNCFKQLCLYIHELSKSLSSTHYELTPVIITKYKQIRSDQKANTNTSPEMKISCNVKQGTSSGKNSSQTVKIKDKTNEKKPYLEQNISNHQLDKSDQKANTNTSPEMKISHNAEQATPSEKISSQTVEIKDKTNKKNPYLEQNISNHKLDRSDQKQNTKTSTEIKICHNVEQDTSPEFALYTNKRKFEERNNNFTNKRFRNDPNNTPETIQSNLIKRKINHEIDRSHKKQKVDNDNISNTSTTNINDACKLNQNTNKIKNVQVKLTDVMTLIHKQKNQKAYKIAQKDNEICKKYGHNLKICLLRIDDINKTLQILINRVNSDKTNPILIQRNNSKKKNHVHNETGKISNNEKQKYGKNLDDSIKIFNNLISEGPIYVCSVCQQTQFKDKVNDINRLKKNKYTNLLNQCKTNYKSVNNQEYICHTCKDYIYKGKIPKLSIKNGCGFPHKPDELNLFNLEERFISPVMAFMLIHQLLPGGQLSLSGSICHLPIEIGKIINTLPRTFDQYETISVKLKRRLCYKNTVFNENVRPHKIIAALQYLLKTSQLYKENNININPEWLEHFTQQNKSTSLNTEQQYENKQSENNIDSSDEEITNEEQPNAPSVNTLLAENTIDPNKNILCIAPAEGQKPIFTDADTEYLCFPTIFCGKRRNNNKYHKLTKREIFKYEMRSVDRRVSTNIPNIFWKTKHKQINQIHQQVSFALRRNQTKGKKITAKTLLNKDTREKIVKYDDGYRIFKNIRSSPPYFEHKRKDLMAMIRQLGIPTLFISLSAADTKWLELLQSIYKLTNKKNITHEQLEKMPWNEKCNLISKDPGTCALYFNHRVKKFIKHILKSPYSPFGKLLNFFYRVEFQHRGSPHIHGLLWIENAPHYEKDNDNEIIKYVDSIISCATNKENKKYIDLQLHKHSKTCIKKKNNKKQCRFGAPWPPLNTTQILYPLDEHHLQNKELYSKLYNDINKFIQLKYKNKEFINFDQILNELNMSYETYILALRSTINKKKIFLKRSLEEIYINSYMSHLIHVWKANHDIQYVLDPYSCVVYICDYLMKNNKGMSKLLENAAKEAKEGNMDLKQSVRHIGNKFLNCSEMSEQECAYSLLELPITQSSIKVEFINTSEIHNRVFIAKPDYMLQKMDPDSEEIKQQNNVDKYAQRPHVLKQICLADFVALTDTVYSNNPIVSDDEMSVNENSSDEENEDITKQSSHTHNFNQLFPIKIKNKTIKLRKHRKVIRFVNYKYKVDPENYCREKLLLYIPWQQNELKILEKFKTYIDAYNHFQKQIHEKMKIYEPAAQIIEHALLEYEEHPDKFIPNSSSTIEDNINSIIPETDVIDDSYKFLIPDDNTEMNNYDLQQDLKIQKYNYIDSIQTKPNILDNTELIKLINSLNCKQYEFFLYIMQQQLHNEDQQTLVCLHGGAGTGKSYALKAIYQGLNKILNQKPGQQTNDLTTLLIAPTGKAAHNIKGHTIHAAFHVPANQSLMNYSKLSWDNLNSYRSKYLNLKWIICDEISMVSNYMLKFIHLRLQEIKSNNLPFGGVNVITVGDLYQLKPVMGQFVFEDYRNNYGPLATNLWTEHFKIYELTEIMRQKDDKKFAQLLNRLRIGAHTKNDIKILKSTKTKNKHLKNKNSIPHFYPTLQQVHLHNEKVTKNPNNFCIKSICSDILPASISKILETNINAAISKRKITHTGGLPQDVTLITNEQYDLISNIDVEDGLINGAQCIIKYIQTTQKNDDIFPYIVWAEFENKDIGTNFRKKYAYLYSTQTNRQWTPIIKIKRTFIVKDHWVHRIQFPLRQAAARSIHVSQSSTYPEIYVDLEALSTPPKPFWEHMHYVAFSRVTSIAGLYIESINEKNISVSMKVSDYLKNALQNNKLQTNIQFSNKDTLNILLNNSRSFKKHFNAIQHNKLILQQHINIFLESKLCKHDKSIDYIIDDYMIVRADQKNNLTPTYGIISYLKNEIEIHKIQYMSTETIDTLYINITFKSKTISIFSIYNSPKNSYLQIEKHLIQLLDKEIITSNNLIVLGDFNIQYNSSNYMKLCSKLSKYNLQQHVNKYTTINNTTIDFIFTNLQIQTINILYAHWSDHHILQCQLNI